ncbi:hypothetical protein [Streptomyces sp. NBC_01754]|uniref:hypothetical protein n=1 Tax=Streptomyces sp. NBC_01754 TaxID=2975930 RepID=UPI002DDC4AA1|nr:hypothetical protein [Streptomyces sp. NBC_01754]
MTDPAWPYLADESFFSGEVTGGVDAYEGWVLLDDSSGFVRDDGFMTYTATRDPLLVAAVRKSPGTSEGEAPDGREAEVVGARAVVLPCAQGDLHLAVEARQQYLEARKRHPDLPRRDACFESFVKSATETFDCGTAARH